MKIFWFSAAYFNLWSACFSKLIANILPLIFCAFSVFFFLFSTWVFFQEHSPSTGLQGKGEGIYLTPLYHFQPLHRHLDISRVITAEVSPLHIASSRSRTRNLFLVRLRLLAMCRGSTPSAILLLLMYVLSYIGCNVCTNGCNWSDVLTIAFFKVFVALQFFPEVSLELCQTSKRKPV